MNLVYVYLVVILAVVLMGGTYAAGLTAGEWKGKAETYQSIMDNQVATMKALGK